MQNGQAFQFRGRATRPGLLVACFLIFAGFLPGSSLFGVSPATKTRFDPRRDGFAFANDTVRVYAPDASGDIKAHARNRPVDFAHSCFLLSRATMQFHKFARFAPGEPKVSDAEYRRLAKTLFRIPVWFPPAGRPPVVIPGYRDLHEFSAAQKAMLQDTMGSWLMTYFRVGNWRMTFPFPRAGQKLAADRLTRKLDQGHIQAVYLAHFPRMNHCVVLYDYTRKPDGDVTFLLLDPNYPGQPSWLKYHAKSRSFELQKRFYYNLGTVNLMRVYLSPFH